MQPILSGGRLFSMRESATAGTQLRQAVEVAHRLPDRVGRRVDDARHVDPDHEASSPLLRAGAGWASTERGRAHALRDRAELAALHADLAQQLVDQRRLRAEAQRAVDHRRRAPTPLPSPSAPPPPPRPSTCRILMPSIRSIGLTLSRMIAFHLLDQAQAQRRGARLGRQHVLRLVHQARALGLDLVADLQGERADLLGVRLGLGLRADRRAAVGGGRLLGFGGHAQPQALALGLAARPRSADAPSSGARPSRSRAR